MKFLVLISLIIFLSVSTIQAQTCESYFGYYSLSTNELVSLQELASAEINIRVVQKTIDRSASLLEIEKLKKSYRDHGISNDIYERVLRDVYHSFVADGYLARGRNHEQEQILFRQRAELEEARVQEEHQNEVDRILEKLGARTLSEALWEVTVSGSKEDIAEILEKPYLLKRLDLNAQDIFGSVLHIAAQYGTPLSIKNIVALGLDVNVSVSRSQGTPLDKAYENKNNFFTLLKLNAKSRNINDLLGDALKSLNTDFDVLMYLAKNATDVNYKPHEDSLNPIFSFINLAQWRARSNNTQDISHQDTQLLKVLIEKGANPFSVNHEEKTPLDIAIYPTTISLLKEAQAKWRAQHKGAAP